VHDGGVSAPFSSKNADKKNSAFPSLGEYSRRPEPGKDGVGGKLPESPDDGGSRPCEDDILSGKQIKSLR